MAISFSITAPHRSASCIGNLSDLKAACLVPNPTYALLVPWTLSSMQPCSLRSILPYYTNRQWKSTMNTHIHLIFHHITPLFTWILGYSTAWPDLTAELTPNPTNRLLMKHFNEAMAPLKSLETTSLASVLPFHSHMHVVEIHHHEHRHPTTSTSTAAPNHWLSWNRAMERIRREESWKKG